MEINNIRDLNAALSSAKPKISFLKGVKIELTINGETELYTRNAIVQLAKTLNMSKQERKEFNELFQNLDERITTDLSNLPKKHILTKLMIKIKQALGNRSYNRHADFPLKNPDSASSKETSRSLDTESDEQRSGEETDSEASSNSRKESSATSASSSSRTPAQSEPKSSPLLNRSRSSSTSSSSEDLDVPIEEPIKEESENSKSSSSSETSGQKSSSSKQTVKSVSTHLASQVDAAESEENEEQRMEKFASSNNLPLELVKGWTQFDHVRFYAERNIPIETSSSVFSQAGDYLKNQWPDVEVSFFEPRNMIVIRQGERKLLLFPEINIGAVVELPFRREKLDEMLKDAGKVCILAASGARNEDDKVRLCGGRPMILLKVNIPTNKALNLQAVLELVQKVFNERN